MEVEYEMKTECKIFNATGMKTTKLECEVCECEVCEYKNDCLETILDDAQLDVIERYAKAITRIRRVIEKHER